MVEMIAALMLLCQTHACHTYRTEYTITVVACVPELDRTSLALVGKHLKTGDKRVFVISYQTCHNT